jgi:ABC-type sugar transport system substrate-binding protein
LAGVLKTSAMLSVKAYLRARLAAIVAASLTAILPAAAADDVSLADLKAATRSLGFLQNPPHSNDFVVGIVYVPGSAGSKTLGQQTADRIRTLPGPKDSGLKTEIITVNDLANHADRLDALYLLPGTSAGAPAIVDMARRKHLLVMSNDPACLDQHCCMLMVRDTGRVEIVMDSALAQSAGVTFSSVFAMMVKHK